MSKYMGFIIAMLLSVALVFEASTIVYASEPTINFAVSSASGKPGDTVNITISISGNTLGISSLGIALTYDREKLELGSPISNQSNSNLPLDDYYKDSGTGTQIFSMGNDIGLFVENNVPILTLPFKIKDDASNGKVDLILSSPAIIGGAFDTVATEYKEYGMTFSHGAISVAATSNDASLASEDPQESQSNISDENIKPGNASSEPSNSSSEPSNASSESSNASSEPSNGNQLNVTTPMPSTPKITKPFDAPGTKVSVMPSSSPLILNGVKTVFPAFLIHDFNWLKLRDLAMILNGTKKQFSVGWDSTNNVATIASGKPYEAVSDELKPLPEGNQAAVSTTQKFVLDGKQVELAGYNCNDYNYIRLRDIAILLDFNLLYNASDATVTIDLNNNYLE